MDEPVPVAPPPKPFPLLPLLLSIFVLLLLGSTTFLAYQNTQLQKQIAELQKPLPSPSPIPTQPPADIASWSTYSNNTYKYSIKYPNSFIAGYFDGIAGSLNKITGTEQEITITTSINDIYKYFFQIQVIDISSLNKTFTTLVNDNYNANKSHFQTTDITNLISKVFAGRPAYEYSFTGKAMETLGWSGVVTSGRYKVVMFEKDGKVFAFYLTDTDMFNLILSTFSFFGAVPTPTCRPRPACLDATPRCLIPETSDMCPKVSPTPKTTYTCPPNGYVDCMPILTPEKQVACSVEAMAWYKANCPNFKGGAL